MMKKLTLGFTVSLLATAAMAGPMKQSSGNYDPGVVLYNTAEDPQFAIDKVGLKFWDGINETEVGAIDLGMGELIGADAVVFPSDSYQSDSAYININETVTGEHSTFGYTVKKDYKFELDEANSQYVICTCPDTSVSDALSCDSFIFTVEEKEGNTYKAFCPTGS